jgi:hypothetical protein
MFVRSVGQFGGPFKKGQISLGGSAYCRARQKLPTLVASQVFQIITERLYGRLPSNALLPGRNVFVCDGSTLQLPYSAELAKAYPPHRNQQGSHWPYVRIVVLQNVQTGLAMSPQWGPETESEQCLALRAIANLPAGAVVLGDRNLGVFGIALAARNAGHDVLLRLTKVRAERVAGQVIEPGEDRAVTWSPSRWDTCGGPYPDRTSIDGRLLCIAAADPKQEEPLFLFTTLDIPAATVANLYALRWNVESDLRSIKQTVRLHQLSARSIRGLHNELLTAFAAYNLVRAVVCLAAERAKVPPRRISFTNVYTLLRTFTPDLQSGDNAGPSPPVWDRIIDLAAYYKLPNRSKKRSYPRAVWSKGERFPLKRGS